MTFVRNLSNNTVTARRCATLAARLDGLDLTDNSVECVSDVLIQNCKRSTETEQ